METDKHNKIILMYLRKYKGVVLALVGIPLLLNVACYFSLPFFNQVGSAAWLSFWGGYLGSAIMACVTLYVLQKQLKQNHNENESNRNHVQTMHEQEVQERWFNDLKQACIKLTVAFDHNDIIKVRDLDPMSECFRERSTQLLARMNESAFNFEVTFKYFKGTLEDDKYKVLMHCANEYMALVLDMHALSVYGQLLKEKLDADLTPDEIKNKFRPFIESHKRDLKDSDVKNRVWNLLLTTQYYKLECVQEVLRVMMKRTDNFKMKEIRGTITSLLRTEYNKINPKDDTETKQTGTDVDREG